jgi:hypothetical protein
MPVCDRCAGTGAMQDANVGKADAAHDEAD